jgi:hypothetical protein
MVITSPISRVCTAAPAAFGPVFPPAPGVTDDVVVGTDGVGSTNDGCTALTNGGAIAGNFAYVDRGACTFQVKVDNADAAGATGIVVGDNVAGRAPISMSGTADIYGLMVTLADGARIKSVGEVNMTIKASGTAPVDDSYRWLMGEDSTAFGGAIRDMWNPNCYGDPGKVTDAQYHCDTSDGGGVHTNSGVPNHGYSLLVDGGTFNGVAVTGIGLDKAAAIYFRAMEQYQTPTTDFADHADALETACTDLIGEPFRQLTTAPNVVPVNLGQIAASDCTQVGNVIEAVELRTEPVQCNFQPILKPGTAPKVACGNGFNATKLFTEDFGDGLAGWTASHEIVYPGGGHLPWVADNTAPGGHAGGTARGVGTDDGQCTQAAGDFSSRDSITSAEIGLPAGTQGLRLTFDHYIASEFEYDGGNVKFSVNGGAFQAVPASAYTFNPPNAVFEETNPMAGQDGFSGTDGGEVTSTWGQSQINLDALKVKGGDKLRLRFDFGRDGCGGLDGWYVDNVTVEGCVPKGTPPVPPGPPVPVDSTTVLRIKDKKPEFREDFKAKVKVKAEGVAPRGKVKLLADGKKVGKGRLNAKGKVIIKVTKNLKPGKYKVVAKYRGSSTVEPSKDKVKIRIRRR